MKKIKIVNEKVDLLKKILKKELIDIEVNDLRNVKNYCVLNKIF